MASHVFVVDSTFKRTQIKVTPGKSLREVLEEACTSRKLNPEEYMLKGQNNKPIDLSQPFRLSGLSAGAKLQLTQASKSPGVVSVALQLPESEGSKRLSDKFPSNTSLWLILRKFEDAVAGGPVTKINLTQRGVPSNDSGAGRLLYEQPCLHVVGRNFETFADLQKTLAQLGLNGGSALLRLAFKKTEQPLEEAMVEISGYFSSSDTQLRASGVTPQQPTEGVAAVGDDTTIATPDVPSQQEVAGEPVADQMADVALPETTVVPPEAEVAETSFASTSSPPTVTTAPNGISVYRPPSSNTPAAALQPDDPSVFEPTIDHAKAHQAALNRAGKNTRLLSDKELAEQEAQRQQTLAAVRNVVVRVRYPDQSQIETTITPTDTAADIYERVSQTLAAAPEEPFELRYTAGPGGKTHHQTLPRSATVRLVRDCGFRGKMMLTLVWSPESSLKARQPPSLKEEYRAHAKELKVELANISQQVAEQSGNSAQGSNGGGAGGSETGKKMNPEDRMKRFLGLGKGKK